MSNYESNLDTMINRAFEKRCDSLSSIIDSENLYEYELGHVDIIYADELSCAIVPCEEYMILAREHYDNESKSLVSEYAVYTQHDKDGDNIRNSLNMNAVYKFMYVCEETFTNTAYAIAHAATRIHAITDSKKGG